MSHRLLFALTLFGASSALNGDLRPSPDAAPIRTRRGAGKAWSARRG
jgi:hypothetical protein